MLAYAKEYGRPVISDADPFASGHQAHNAYGNACQMLFRVRCYPSTCMAPPMPADLLDLQKTEYFLLRLACPTRL